MAFFKSPIGSRFNTPTPPAPSSRVRLCSCQLRQTGWHLMGQVDPYCPTHGPQARAHDELERVTRPFIGKREPRLGGDLMLD